MTYDEELAERIRDLVLGVPGLSEKRMFGGLAFLVNGNMAVAASGKGGLLLRIDPAQSEALVDGVQVTRMEMRGREMDGWLRIEADAVGTPGELSRWVDLGIEYAGALPMK